MNEISRPEYLEALEVIDHYHLQEDNIERINQSGKTLIREWVASHSCSIRLVNALHNYLEYYPVKYIEDVSMRSFLKVRNAGGKSWVEYLHLREDDGLTLDQIDIIYKQ